MRWPELRRHDGDAVPPVMLRLKLDDDKALASRWADGHVAAITLWEDFAKYVYLPRLRDQDVLMATVAAGPASMTWQAEGFAVAAGYDESSGRYLGLVAGGHAAGLPPTALVVRPDVAVAQQEESDASPSETGMAASGGAAAVEESGEGATAGAAPAAKCSAEPFVSTRIDR